MTDPTATSEEAFLVSQNSETADSPGGTRRHTGRFVLRWGVVATVAYIVILSAYVVACRDAVFRMEPDEFGTFLGGVVSPLAFLWLVLGFFQQGDELRNSADALWLQGEELRHSVEQQRQLVDVTRQQVEAEHAARERAERDAERLAQPTFSVTPAGADRGGLTRTFHFKITNTGLPCTDVSLAYRNKIVREGMLKTGESITASFDFGVGQVIEWERATLSYRDSKGRLGSHGFAFTPREVGGGTILSA